ncbi:hypothetical protein M9Y10_007099 [Tritrichomonas musculus]|uniref:CCZ1/INTU/HSP4 first Longin domain-containing protein n=1 Tax=Tritrichomonas musculus TaxID=1915356 RepID=A0ABR2J316_9EUKA
MDNLIFHDIPQNYKILLALINCDSPRIIQECYSNFSFLNLQLELFNSNENKLKDLLLNFFQKYKFGTYKIEPLTDSLLGNIILCVEKKCLIIESINITIVQPILESLRTEFIDSSSAIPEVKTICHEYYNYIKNNIFVYYTFYPILAYLIKRFFYPTCYFEDPSFFIFRYLSDDQNVKEKENELANIISKHNETNENRFQMIKNHINTEQKVKIFQFNENDFIKLKIISTDNGEALYIAIHIETLYIFLLKKVGNDESQHEIDFCSKYSQRCITRFYGFIKKNDVVVGFVYEFMSNGKLKE